MSLSRIRGQDGAIAHLRSAFEARRLAHAYVFNGPDGVGKETAALELAAALNCEAGGLEGCGACASCRMAAKLAHPDIHLVFPMPRDAKPAEAAEILAEQARAGYRDAGFGRKAAIISVEAVLDAVVAKANQRPYTGPWKVFVVADADAMTPEAANALLKSLEEPPDATVLVLTTSRLNALPATVLSRCQRIQFRRLPRDTVEDILLSDKRVGFNKARARAAAAVSLGSAGRAVRAEGEGLASELGRVADLMTGKRAAGVGPLLNEASQIAFRLGRQEQERLLDLMLLWLRDVLLLRELGDGAPAGEILFERQRRQLEAQARAMDARAIGDLAVRIDDARRAIERYSNPSIVFTSVLVDVAVARRRAEAGGGRAHAA
ncbi:MAG: AAA family ATPase [Candidatus Eisenbacteria bacterium]|nr:AAA family ATPase [Candidatus Eisenbacteria bacterium]